MSISDRRLLLLVLACTWVAAGSLATLAQPEQGEGIRAHWEPADAPIAAPADGRRCDGISGNSDIVTEVVLPPSRGMAQKWARHHDKLDPIKSSVGFATDFLVTGGFSRKRTVERQYFEASARHDLCYIHGAPTYGRERKDCDNQIFKDMYRLCGLADNTSLLGRSSCIYRPPAVKGAVSLFGGAFAAMSGSADMKNICEYESGGFQPTRDHLIIGHFKGPIGSEQILELASVSDTTCPGGALLHGTLIDAILNRKEAFNLCPSKIKLAYANSKELRTLGDLDITVADLLSHAPVRMRLESPAQPQDNIVLFAFHGEDHKGAGAGKGFGALMIPISIAQPDKTLAFQALRRGGDHRKGQCGDDNHHMSACWVPLKTDELAAEREAFSYPIHPVHVMPNCAPGATKHCSDAEQLLLTSTAKFGEGSAMVVATYAFRATLDGFDLIGADREKIGKSEAYKRLQYPALMFDDDGKDGDDIHFLFRDPADRELTDLVVETMHPMMRPECPLGITWAVSAKGENGCETADYLPGKGKRTSVQGWSRESYVWMPLGMSQSTPAGHSRDSELVAEFLSNCSDAAGKKCQGEETIRLRSLQLSGMTNGQPVINEFRLGRTPDQSMDTKAKPSCSNSVREYMKLPVLTGRFGSAQDNGPGLAFFCADGNTLRVLQVWRTKDGHGWQQPQEYFCSLDTDSAWERAKKSPLEVIANGVNQPSTIIFSERALKDGSIQYHRLALAGDAGQFSCKKNDTSAWRVSSPPT